MSTPLQELFTETSCANGLTPLSAEQLDLLISEKGTAWIHAALARVRDGDRDALDTLDKWMKMVRLTTHMTRLRMPVDLGLMTAIVKQHSYNLVSNLVRDANGSDDRVAKDHLDRLVRTALNVRDQKEGQGPSSAQPESRPPQQPPAPPRRPAHMAQMPPPPGTRTTVASTSSAPASRAAAPVAMLDDARRRRDDNEVETQSYHDSRDDRDFEPSRTRDSQPVAQGKETVREYDQAEAYNRGRAGSAVRFQNARDTRKEYARHVVFFEMAAINGDGKTYDWSNKLVMMLNEFETEQALCVMYEFIDSVRFSAHGQDNKSWLQLMNQDKSTRYAGGVQVSAGGGRNRSMVCTIYPQQLTKIRMVLLRAYRAMMGIDSDQAAKTELAKAARNYAVYAEMNPPRDSEGQRRQQSSRGESRQQYG